MSNSTNLAGLTTALAFMAVAAPAYALRATGSSACPSCAQNPPAAVTAPAPTPATPRRHRRHHTTTAPGATSASVAPVAQFSCESRTYLSAADLDHNGSVTADEVLTYFSRQAHGVRSEARRLIAAEGLDPAVLRHSRSRVLCQVPAASADSRLLNPFTGDGNAPAPPPAPAPVTPPVDLEAALRTNREYIVADVERALSAAAHRSSTRRSQPLGLSLGIGPGALVYNNGDHLEAAGVVEGRVGYDLTRRLTLEVAGGRILGHRVNSSRTLATEHTHSDPAGNNYGYFTESTVRQDERVHRDYDGFVQVGVRGDLGKGFSVAPHVGLLLGEETSQRHWDSHDYLYAADGIQVGPTHHGEGTDAPVAHRVNSPTVGVDLEYCLQLGRRAGVIHNLCLGVSPEYDIGQRAFTVRPSIGYKIEF